MIAVEPAIAPYPGLRPYEHDEAHLFFGRDEQVHELLRRLRLNRFLAVVGTSGCGKSSLVRAGLMPALYGGFMAGAGSSWRIALMKPGSEPLRNLAVALCGTDVFGGSQTPQDLEIPPALFAETTLRRGPLGLIEFVRHSRLSGGESLLIIVDQFEEVFRFRGSVSGREDDAAAVVKLLLEASRQQEQPIFVILTMRSDFLGECPRFRGLPEAINDGQYLVPRLTRDQIRDAITGPAHVGGAEVAPRLVQRLLGEVGEDPDQLPQLQHALMRTWDLWTRDGASGPLDIPHYEQTGGIGGALSLHADDAWSQLRDDRARAIARQIFQRLTEKGERYRDVRRPSDFADLCSTAEASPEETAAVVEVFREPGRSFLMPPASVPLLPETVLDISHESLIRVWSRLQAWVDEESRAAVQWQRLTQSAEWQERGDASYLVEPELSRTLEWWDHWKPNAAWAKRYGGGFERAHRFLTESRRAAEVRQAEEQRRARIEDVRRVVEYFQTSTPAEIAALRETLSRMADPDQDAFSPAAFAPNGPAVPSEIAEKLLSNPPPGFQADGSAMSLSNPGLLFEAWPAAAKWIEEDRPLIRFRREISVLCNAWTSSGNHSDHLLRGPLYHRALNILEENRDRLNAAELEFLEASRKGAVRPRTWVAAGCAIALMCLLHLALMLSSAAHNLGFTGDLPELGQPATPPPPTPAGPDYASSTPPASADLSALTTLDRIGQELSLALGYSQDGPPLRYRLDRFPWSRVENRVRTEYMGRFRTTLFQDTKAALLRSLQSLPATPGPAANFETAYANLKAYLILNQYSQHAAANREFLASTMFRAWSDAVPASIEVRSLAERHFHTFAAFYANHSYGEQPDRAAVAAARSYLAAFSAADRVYRTALATDTRAPLRFAQVQPGSQQFLSVPYEIPMTFEGGKEGWNRTLNLLRRAPEQASSEDWVFGTDTTRSFQRDELFEPLRQRFTEDCITHWRRLLLTAQVLPFATRQDAAQKLRALSSAQSPLAQFLDLVAFNTDLQNQQVTDAFQPVRVSRQAYFQALAALAKSVDRQRVSRVLDRVTEISAQFSPSSDPAVRNAVASLLRQPALHAFPVLGDSE